VGLEKPVNTPKPAYILPRHRETKHTHTHDTHVNTEEIRMSQISHHTSPPTLPATPFCRRCQRLQHAWLHPLQRCLKGLIAKEKMRLVLSRHVQPSAQMLQSMRQGAQLARVLLISCVMLNIYGRLLSCKPLPD
jgi:hypothetical protein